MSEPTLSPFVQYVHDVISRLGGEVREPQMEMINHVVSAISSDTPVIIESPTGTGKSLAYSLPAIFAAERAGKRVLIVTRTKKLQDQLSKDLPRYIEAAVGPTSRITWSSLKGRNHFTCQKRISSSESIPVTLSAWAMGGGGSKDEAPEHLDVEWREVAGGTDCLGKKCPFYDDCPSTKLRQRASAANVVIANQALLAMNFALGAKAIPGEFDIVIIDEAQHFENTMRDQLASSLTPSDLMRTGYAEAADALTALLPRKGYKFHEGIDQGSIFYHTYMNAMARARALDAKIQNDDEPNLQDKKDYNLFKRIATSLGAFTEPHLNVLWIDETGMHSSPIDVREIIQEELGDKASVLTSATIPDDLGLDKEIITISGGFTNAGLYISDISGGGKYEFREDAAQETYSMVNAIGGRSLLLYTSEVAMMDMYYWLKARLDVPIYHQKMANAIDMFRSNETSVLLGIETCWEGIDIMGPSLSLVVIDRLPFPNMNDPIYEAKVARDGWAKASIGPAKTLFRQGVGRLLRSPDDVGVIAVMDNRLKTKGYGKSFLNSIQFQGIPSLEDAIKFLKELAADIESEKS